VKRRLRVPGFAIYYWILVAALFTPLALLVIFAFNDSTIFTFPLSGFTTKWFEEAIHTESLLEAMRNSFMLALMTAALATLLGALGAAAVAWYAFPGKSLFVGVTALPLVFPSVLIGVAMLVFFHELRVPMSMLTICAGELVLCLPVAMLIVIARFAGMSRSLEEASMDLGASYLKTQLFITLPIAAPAMLAAFFTCFVMTFNEFALAFFVSGATNILPIYMFSMLRRIESMPIILAAASLMILGSIAIIIPALIFRLPGRRQERTEVKAEGVPG
jgi:spermidine/putrescine transport system permease protein